jgi:4-phytase/acid phosphatase
MVKLIAAALLLSAAVLPAQSKPHKAPGADQLRFTLILSRHGVRPPLAPVATLNPRSAQPWPEWEAPLGYLTPHGADAIRQMGVYLRSDLAKQNLLPATGCPSDGDIYLYADTDERNIMSSFHTFAAFEPGCKPRPIHTIPPAAGVRDPMFSPGPPAFPALSAEAVAADRRAFAGSDVETFFSIAGNPELNELAKILAPDPAQPAAKPILDDPNPIAVASSLISDFSLEYADNKPMADVGWGRVDSAALHRLMVLQIKAFSLSTRTPLVARTHGSNLMAHILDTLNQAAQAATPAQPVAGAIGPAGARFVYISAHDSNLMNLAGLLNLNWNSDGLAFDTPPDSELVFELWQNPHSKQYAVRLLYRAQTFDQLRSAAALSKTNPPVEQVLIAPGCTTAGPCPLASFDKAVHGLLDPAYVQAAMPALQITPANF